MKVEDTVRTAVDETKFNLTLEKFRAAKSQTTGSDPIKTIELLADKYILNKNEEAGILRHFIMANDNSAFGLINAVTRASQDMEDYNRATELERLGGELLDMPDNNKILSLPHPRRMINVTPEAVLA
ncbi:hypothetical protein [Pectinatus frisingensis]|uniref:hypothetical protein n=1 Tax=Pectinatus frisingensis TaxID=865 RepID=UPI003D80A139